MGVFTCSILASIVTILVSIVIILTSIQPILEKCVHLQVQYLQVLLLAKVELVLRQKDEKLFFYFAPHFLDK